MNFDDYQAVARTTAKYPGAGENLYYPALGLPGESGEILEKVAEHFRASADLTDEARTLLSKEFGDVLWYAAAIASELGMGLSEVALDPSLVSFQASRALPAPRPDAALLAALDLGAAAGAVAERVKKVMRDLGGVVDGAARGKVSAALLGVLDRLAVLASLVGVDLAAAAQQNADKLADRARRSVLSGEGDER